MPKRLTQEEFIQRSIKVHNNKYDYSKVLYYNINSRVCINCSEHGEFIQRAEDHLRGYRCTKCGRISCKNTLISRYGVDNPSKSKEIRDKVKQTNIIKYGSENVLNSTIISEKIKNGNLIKYGVTNPLKSKKIQQKARNTNLARYGVVSASQHPTVKARTISNNIIKYGVSHPNQKHIPVHNINCLEDYNWLYNEYIIRNKTAEQIAVELNIVGSTVIRYLKKHNIQTKHKTNYSRRAIMWLELVMKEEDIFIQHAKNIGEYTIPNTVYRVDGFCSDTNTVYEFYGDIWHGNPKIYKPEDICNPFSKLTAEQLYNKTINRENIILNMNYNLITIWEHEYMRGNVNAY